MSLSTSYKPVQSHAVPATSIPSPLDALLSVTEQLWEQQTKNTTQNSVSDKSSTCTEASFESIDARTKRVPVMILPSRRNELSKGVTTSSGQQLFANNAKPKRPLSAYNLFFRHERAKIVGIPVGSSPVNKGQKRRHVTSHGKIGFSELGRLIGKRWKQLNRVELQYFESLAAKEKRVYEIKLREYHRRLKCD